MITKEILIEARTKIEQGWCQGNYALGPDGKWRDWHDPEAVRWCAVGAINAAGGIGVQSHRARAVVRLVLPNSGYLDHWNDSDGRTQAEVLAAFDRAIEACGILEPTER